MRDENNYEFAVSFGMLSNEDNFTLKTKRLILEIIRQEDIDFIHNALSDEDVTRYYAVHFNTLEETQQQMDWYANLLEQQSGHWWKLTDKHHATKVGACGFNNWNHHKKTAEIGFWLLPNYQGRGLMSEALSKIIHFGFETMQLRQIWAEVEKENHNSLNLLQAKGFKRLDEEAFIEEKYGKQIWVDKLVRRADT